MNKFKFYNPATGKMLLIPFKTSVARGKDPSGNNTIRTGSLQQMVTEMNKLGFVRGGHKQVLNSVEKELIQKAAK